MRTGGGDAGDGGSSDGGSGGSGGTGDKVTFEHEENVDFEPLITDPETASAGPLKWITIGARE